MSKKNAAADVDALLDGAQVSETKGDAKPAKKAKADAKPAKIAGQKPVVTKSRKAIAGFKPAKKAAKAEKKEAAAVPADSPVRKALLKVRKAVTYADFAEANGFNIRTVRRMARGMRDAGEIELVKDGQIVQIKPAV